MIGFPDYRGGDKKYARSLFAVRDIAQGEVFTSENIRSIRPGEGLHPRYLRILIGTHAICTIKRGTPLDKSMISVELI
jgi:pseudaminic acid synthase